MCPKKTMDIQTKHSHRRHAYSARYRNMNAISHETRYDLFVDHKRPTRKRSSIAGQRDRSPIRSARDHSRSSRVYGNSSRSPSKTTKKSREQTDQRLLDKTDRKKSVNADAVNSKRASNHKSSQSSQKQSDNDHKTRQKSTTKSKRSSSDKHNISVNTTLLDKSRSVITVFDPDSLADVKTVTSNSSDQYNVCEGHLSGAEKGGELVEFLDGGHSHEHQRIMSTKVVPFSCGREDKEHAQDKIRDQVCEDKTVYNHERKSINQHIDHPVEDFRDSPHGYSDAIHFTEHKSHAIEKCSDDHSLARIGGESLYEQSQNHAKEKNVDHLLNFQKQRETSHVPVETDVKGFSLKSYKPAYHLTGYTSSKSQTATFEDDEQEEISYSWVGELLDNSDDKQSEVLQAEHNLYPADRQNVDGSNSNKHQDLVATADVCRQLQNKVGNYMKQHDDCSKEKGDQLYQNIRRLGFKMQAVPENLENPIGVNSSQAGPRLTTQTDALDNDPSLNHECQYMDRRAKGDFLLQQTGDLKTSTSTNDVAVEPLRYNGHFSLKEETNWSNFSNLDDLEHLDSARLHSIFKKQKELETAYQEKKELPERKREFVDSDRLQSHSHLSAKSDSLSVPYSFTPHSLPLSRYASDGTNMNRDNNETNWRISSRKQSSYDKSVDGFTINEEYPRQTYSSRALEQLDKREVLYSRKQHDLSDMDVSPVDDKASFRFSPSRLVVSSQPKSSDMRRNLVKSTMDYQPFDRSPKSQFQGYKEDANISGLDALPMLSEDKNSKGISKFWGFDYIKWFAENILETKQFEIFVQAMCPQTVKDNLAELPLRFLQCIAAGDKNALRCVPKNTNAPREMLGFKRKFETLERGLYTMCNQLGIDMIQDDTSVSSNRKQDPSSNKISRKVIDCGMHDVEPSFATAAKPVSKQADLRTKLCSGDLKITRSVTQIPPVTLKGDHQAEDLHGSRMSSSTSEHGSPARAVARTVIADDAYIYDKQVKNRWASTEGHHQSGALLAIEVKQPSEVHLDDKVKDQSFSHGKYFIPSEDKFKENVPTKTQSEVQQQHADIPKKTSTKFSGRYFHVEENPRTYSTGLEASKKLVFCTESKNYEDLNLAPSKIMDKPDKQPSVVQLKKTTSIIRLNHSKKIKLRSTPAISVRVGGGTDREMSTPFASSPPISETLSSTSLKSVEINERKVSDHLTSIRPVTKVNVSTCLPSSTKIMFGKCSIANPPALCSSDHKTPDKSKSQQKGEDKKEGQGERVKASWKDSRDDIPLNEAQTTGNIDRKNKAAILKAASRNINNMPRKRRASLTSNSQQSQKLAESINRQEHSAKKSKPSVSDQVTYESTAKKVKANANDSDTLKVTPVTLRRLYGSRHKKMVSMEALSDLECPAMTPLKEKHFEKFKKHVKEFIMKRLNFLYDFGKYDSDKIKRLANEAANSFPMSDIRERQVFNKDFALFIIQECFKSAGNQSVSKSVERKLDDRGQGWSRTKLTSFYQFYRDIAKECDEVVGFSTEMQQWLKRKVSTIEYEIELLYPQFSGDARSVVRHWFWTNLASKIIDIGKEKNSSNYKQPSEERVKKLKSWLSTVYECPPCEATRRTNVSVLKASKWEGMSKQEIIEVVTSWWIEGYYHVRYDKVENLETEEEAENRESANVISMEGMVVLDEDYSDSDSTADSINANSLPDQNDEESEYSEDVSGAPTILLF